MWLVPRFRRLCRVGLPVFAVFMAAGFWFSDPANMRRITDTVGEIRREIESRPEFQVNVVGIEGASPALADEIRVVLGIDLPVSSFELDLDMLRARISGLPGVAGAELRIRGSGYLAVLIEERQPAMVWQTRGGAVLIDETGTFVAALSDRPDTPPLPQIAGEGADLAAAEAIELFEAASPLGDRLRGLVRVGERRWDVVLTDGRRILLPAHGARAELDRLIALDDLQDLLARDVVRVDMRNPERLTLQLTPHALEEMRRMQDFIRQGQQGQGDNRG
ncbi:cell division protein FtsQ [Rhodobacterales bacterium HKCCE2091]|nr:cell division protein FtsQ [Rhodobacterales bacterium HKCCE2091]